MNEETEQVHYMMNLDTLVMETRLPDPEQASDQKVAE